MRKLFLSMADHRAAQRRKNDGPSDAEIAKAMRLEQERLARLDKHADLVKEINAREAKNEH
jgi:hypothetical protein